MGGLRKLTPWTHGVFFVCWLAICGVPPFSGFFSKDAIVASAFATHAFGEHMAWVGPVVGVALLTAALGTAFYMSRLYFLVFTGGSRADEDTKHHIHESPWEMVGPLVVLAAGAAIVGFLGLPGSLNWFASWLEPSVGPELHIEHNLEIGLMVGSTIIAAAGIGLAYVFYYGGYRAPARQFAAAVPGFVQLVRDKFRVDELYDLVIIRPLKVLSRGLFLVVDRVLIDRILVHGFAFVVDVSGRIARMLQVGDPQRYIAAFAIGVAALFWIATRPPRPDDVKVKIDGATVEADVSGAGGQAQNLIYRFDFDGDGFIDRQGRSPVQRFSYEGSGRYTIHVEIRDPRWDTVTTLEKKVNVRAAQ
jgi:NADH-quinone oxidoreductase subunit L